MLPREISVEHWPERTTFTLPVRPLGRWRLLGLIPMVLGVVFACVPVHLLGPVFHQAQPGQTGLFPWVFLAPLAVFVLFALTPVGIGLFLLVGQCRLVVTRDRVIATEFAGPIFWRRKVRAKDLLRIQVGGAAPAAGRSPPRAFLGIGMLAAVLQRGKLTVLAAGYPTEWMTALAGEISGLMKLQGITVPVTDVLGTQLAVGAAPPAAPAQPAGSLVKVSTANGGLQLDIPSRGFWKESYGLVLFGCLWSAMTGVFTVASCVHHDAHARGDFSLPGLVAFLGLFWAVGLSMCLFGVHLGTRKWSIVANQDGLSARIESALRSRTLQWKRGEILGLRVGDSSVEVNHRRLRELQVQPVGGKHRGLLAGRDEAELAWMASLLRHTLGLQ